MSWVSKFYDPLPTPTSIRVLLLGPGLPDDEEIFCWVLPTDLDRDDNLSPHTTQQSIELLGVVTGRTHGGEVREFCFGYDLYLGGDESGEGKGLSKGMHPFQRYEALSYVWGDNTTPRNIVFNGEHRFPVTENLYAALRSLRLHGMGRKLWVDAICINQSDAEEKKTQIEMMRRVFQQADKVIAYVPLSTQDEDNIKALLPIVVGAGKDLMNQKKEVKDRNSMDAMTSGPDSLNSVTDLSTNEILGDQKDGKGGLSVQDAFLSSKNLPPAESPLWLSWQRFVASPYFRRTWIIQEFALAKTLEFWFGTTGFDEHLILLAHSSLKMLTGGNLDSGIPLPLALGSGSADDALELSQNAYAGSISAGSMFSERILVQDGSPMSRLIDQLKDMRAFKATDPRDKIYALLGLTCDGPTFHKHISYAPDETPTKVFLRFTKLFIERGEGFELLLEAGLDDNHNLPSWLPDWGKHNAYVGRVMLQTNNSPNHHMQVIDDDQTLLIRGTVIDEIDNLSDYAMGTMEVTSTGVSDTAFVKGMVSGFKMMFTSPSLESWSVDDLFEGLFNILAQLPGANDDPAPIDRVNLAVQSLSMEDDGNTDEVPSTVAKSNIRSPKNGDVERSDEWRKELRDGFRSFMSWLVWLSKQKVDDKGTHVKLNSPTEFHSFKDRAMKTTAYRRFCVTKDKRIGLVLERSKVGDHVAMFEGSDNTFVLREDVGRSPREAGDTESARFRLVGNAYVHDMGPGKGHSETTVQDLFLY